MFARWRDGPLPAHHEVDRLGREPDRQGGKGAEEGEREEHRDELGVEEDGGLDRDEPPEAHERDRPECGEEDRIAPARRTGRENENRREGRGREDRGRAR